MATWNQLLARNVIDRIPVQPGHRRDTVCCSLFSPYRSVVDWGLPDLLALVIVSVALFFSNWIFTVVKSPSLLLLALLFPRPKQFIQRYPRLVLALLYGPIPIMFTIFGPTALTGWIRVLGMVLLSLAALAQSFFTMRDPVGRARMRWAASGLVAGQPVNLNHCRTT